MGIRRDRVDSSDSILLEIRTKGGVVGLKNPKIEFFASYCQINIVNNKQWTQSLACYMSMIVVNWAAGGDDVKRRRTDDEQMMWT
jgi:hypothetical protein